MKKLEHDLLIVPDVHCRPFWKVPVDKFRGLIDSGEMDVIFLGDYIDPYPFEIHDGTAFDVEKGIGLFEEIVSLASSHRDNVHLLLGNHDLPYFDEEYAANIYKCRYSYEFAPKISSVFDGARDLFQIAWECSAGGKDVLFTHAGVLKSWVTEYFGPNAPSVPNADFLNAILKSGSILCLAAVGTDRGGYGPGSAVWADVHEHIYGWLSSSVAKRNGLPGHTVYDDGPYQVFGHTLSYPSLDGYEIGEKFAMLDSRQCFIMSPDGKISPFAEKMSVPDKAE